MMEGLSLLRGHRLDDLGMRHLLFVDLCTGEGFASTPGSMPSISSIEPMFHFLQLIVKSVSVSLPAIIFLWFRLPASDQSDSCAFSISVSIAHAENAACHTVCGWNGRYRRASRPCR